MHLLRSANRALVAPTLAVLSLPLALLAQTPDPLFITNAGQWPSDLSARAKVGGGSAWFHDGGLALRLVRLADNQPADAGSVGGPARVHVDTTVQLGFGRGARHVTPIAEGAESVAPRWVRRGANGQPENLQTEARAALRYSQVWPGIDVVFRGVDGRVAYEFDLAPGCSAGTIEFTTGGLSAPLSIAADGSLVMTTELGSIRHTAPQSFELASDGRRIRVPSGFELRGDGRFGFTVERRDASRALWIDPGIDWATMFGGAGNDILLYSEHVTSDLFASSGWTDSSLPAPWSTTTPGSAEGVLVTAFDTSGGVLWTTIIDGSGTEWALDMAFDASTGLTTVGGVTNSSDLPTTVNATQPALSGGWDGFLAQFDLAGNLTYLSYYGGTGEDRIVDVVAQAGIVTVVGATSSTNLAMAGTPWQPANAGSIDAFVAQFDTNLTPANQLLRSTFIGSPYNDGAPFNPAQYWKNYDNKHVFVAANGDVTVVTNTLSSGTPLPTTPGAYDSTTNGSWDIWIGRFDALLSTLQAATLFGGSGFDAPTTADIDNAGVVTFGNVNQSPNLPVTPGAFATTASGSNDTFFARIDLTQTGANQLLYGSYFGGTGIDEGNEMMVDPSSSIVTVVGQTRDVGFGIPATAGAYQTSAVAGAYPWHGFVLRISMDGNGPEDVQYASYISPAAGTEVTALARAHDGRYLLVGGTYATSIPAASTGAQPVSNGSYDGYAVLMDLLPAGVDPIGAASPSCAPAAHMQVNSQPTAGNARFALLCENAPDNAVGVIAIGQVLAAGLPVLGIDAWVNPFATLLVLADGNGFGSFDLPIPATAPAPIGLAAQFAWLDPNPCAGNLLTASNALRF